MKYAILLAAGPALALGACRNAEEPAPDASASPTEAVEAASAGAAFTAGQPPSKLFMVGIWGEGDACDQPIDFQADGTIKDGPVDTWELTDGQLVMGDLFTLSLTVVDENTMQARGEGDTEPTTLKRCG